MVQNNSKETLEWRSFPLFQCGIEDNPKRPVWILVAITKNKTEDRNEFWLGFIAAKDREEALKSKADLIDSEEGHEQEIVFQDAFPLVQAMMNSYLFYVVGNTLGGKLNVDNDSNI